MLMDVVLSMLTHVHMHAHTDFQGLQHSPRSARIRITLHVLVLLFFLIETRTQAGPIRGDRPAHSGDSDNPLLSANQVLISNDCHKVSKII
jgi:hypothetical protein